MSLIRKYFNQTRKPEGTMGKLMLSSMNSGHAKLSDWGFTRLPRTDLKTAIDLGCGAGANAKKLLNKYPNAHVTALDYSELSVRKTDEYNREAINNGRCTVLQGDVADLKLPENSFDLATAFETVYFWPGLEQCFAQVAKILRKDGVFVICNESDGNDATSKKFEGMIEGMKCYTTEQIKAALNSAGFSAITCDHHPNKPWITVVARK